MRSRDLVLTLALPLIHYDLWQDTVPLRASVFPSVKGGGLADLSKSLLTGGVTTVWPMLRRGPRASEGHTDCARVGVQSWK